MSVGYIFDEIFLQHQAPREHPECPQRLVSIQKELSQYRQKLQSIPARQALREELELAHTPGYLDTLFKALEKKQGYLDPDTFFNEFTQDAALRAAGGAIDLATQVAKGELKSGAAFVRPPGHHATKDRAMGFCIFNNIALATKALLANNLAKRPMIIDWDVHHGNGTEDIFWDDPDVLFLSLHQFPLYPGTGRASDIGGKTAKGKTINIPLSPGAADDVYLSAWDQIVEPVVKAFKPDILLISAGYDAYEGDPLAQMMLSRQGFATLAKRAKSMMKPFGEKIVAVLEGGYNTDMLGLLVKDLLQILSEETIDSAEKTQTNPLQKGAEHVMANLKEIHKEYWNL